MLPLGRSVVLVLSRYTHLFLTGVVAGAGILFVGDVHLASQGSTIPTTQLTDTVPGGPPPTPIGISRDGSRIVFLQGCVNCPGGGQLWSVNSDGSFPVQMTPSSLNVGHGHFGGTKVVFVACETPCGSPEGDVYVSNADGTGLTRLTTDGTGPIDYPVARISGDGTRVVYVQHITSVVGIERTWFVADADGNNSTTLSLPSQVQAISVNADGSRLGLSYAQSGSFKIGVQDVGQTSPLELLDTGGFPADIDLSGDGQILAFAGPVSIIRTDGASAPQILDATPNVPFSHISTNHDGSVVCYSRGDSLFSPPQNIFCVNNSNTGSPINVTNVLSAGPETDLPFLSANGAVVTFRSSADLVPGQNSDGSFEVFAVRLRSAIDDDFNDNFLDPAKWESFSGIAGSTIIETNQRLEISLAAGGPGGAGIISRCSLGGNFDVQVDYALINWPPMNLYGLSFGAFELGGSIFRNSSTQSSLEFYTVVAGGNAAQVPTTDTSGTLRLVRIGSTLSGLFLSGSTWTQVGSGNVNTGTTRFSLGVGPAASAPGDIQVALDNFRANLGTVVCPSAAPTVTGINPTSGPTAGGTSVTITGTGFVTGASVMFDSALATVLDVQPTAIMALTPPHTAGPVDVVVTNPDGQSDTLADSFTYIAAIVPQVVSLTWEELDSPLDENPNVGGGQRIFPDRQFPTDSTDRRKVRLRAILNVAAGGIAVFFRSFDPDDPSADGAPVDPNGPFGRDNRGNRPPSVCAEVGATRAVSDGSGVAEATFTVTTHPGDNFLAAASTDQAYLNEVCLGSTGFDLRDAADNRLPTARGQTTRMLTIWRRLHVEVDSMGAVTGNTITGSVTNAAPALALGLTRVSLDASLSDTDGGNRFESGRMTIHGLGSFTVLSNEQHSVLINGIVTRSQAVGRPFTLVDDDDFNSDDTPSNVDGDYNEDVAATYLTLSLMQDSDDPVRNLFAPAYIRPIYDEGGVSNDRDNADFTLNIANDHAFAAQVRDWWDSGGNESDDYWITYVQLGYQPDVGRDYDPDRETSRPLFGATDANPRSDVTDNATGVADVPRGGEHTILYLETIRDYARINGERFLARIAPHEIGHQFGLKGDTTSGFGIMSYRDAANEFVPTHLNVLRWRVRSPGR